MHLHTLHLGVWRLVQYCSTTDIWKVPLSGCHRWILPISPLRDKSSTLVTLKKRLQGLLCLLFTYYMCLCVWCACMF